MKNKIGWCNLTWNPITGCRNNCPYCYAREINTRFRFIKFWNEPTWIDSNFNKKFPRKSQKIFIGSMSEIYYWDEIWMEKVLEKIKQYPQHTFQFLTKFPEVYEEWVFPKNCWLGITITDNKAFYNMDFTINKVNTKRIKFISIEPILEDINIKYIIDSLHLDWVILGAETGNRKGRVIPKKEWIESIADYCRNNAIPIYLKDSLKNFYPEKIKEFPQTGIKLF